MGTVAESPGSSSGALRARHSFRRLFGSGGLAHPSDTQEVMKEPQPANDLGRESMGMTGDWVSTSWITCVRGFHGQ